MLTTIDAHAGGEPLRLITAGVPRLAGRTMLAKRAEMLASHDEIRRILMWEPRGHADMYGAILTEPVSPEADYGILFMHNEGYSTMCGHGIIAVSTILLETGMHPFSGDSPCHLVYDSPAGLIKATARLEAGRVVQVSFRNVPSFVYSEGVEVTTTFGQFSTPVVFGGAFYALADARQAGLAVRSDQVQQLVDFGMQVKESVERQLEVAHPVETDLTGIYGTIICDDPVGSQSDGRNVTIFADGEVDRSPCGTGTAARLAWLHATGEVATGEWYVHESIIGSTFGGTVVGETSVAHFRAVVPEISGRGFLTGSHTYFVEPDDPLGGGFLVR